MRYILDRIEEDRAVLTDSEGREMILPAVAFAFPLREGMVLETGEGESDFCPRPDLEKEARAKANALSHKVFKRKTEGRRDGQTACREREYKSKGRSKSNENQHCTAAHPLRIHGADAGRSDQIQ